MDAALRRREDGNRDDLIITRLVRLWPLAAAVVAGIVSLSVLKYRVENHEVRIVQVEKNVEELRAIKANTDLLVEHLIRPSRGRGDR